LLIAVACKLRSRPHERRAGRRHRAGDAPATCGAASPSLPAATARRVPKRSLPKSRVARAGSGTRSLRAVAVGSLVRRVPARGVGGASPRASHPCGARAAGAVGCRSSVSACVGAGVVLSVRVSGVRGRASSVGYLSGAADCLKRSQSHPCESVLIRGLNLELRYLCCLLLKT